jgi:hypothetical protein
MRGGDLNGRVDFAGDSIGAGSGLLPGPHPVYRFLCHGEHLCLAGEIVADADPDANVPLHVARLDRVLIKERRLARDLLRTNELEAIAVVAELQHVREVDRQRRFRQVPLDGEAPLLGR